MKRITWMRKSISALLALAFGVILCCPAAAFAAEEKTVRVGYMDYAGFIDKQLDGTYSGYGAEYLAKISEYTGYHYEYVFGEWADLLKKLENKEIDLLCTAQYTDERAAVYEYSMYPIGYTQGLLYTTTDSTLSYEDFTNFDGKKIGVIRSSAMNQIFRNFAAQKGFTPQLIEYDNEETLLAALEAGDIAAMCSEHLANHKELSPLAAFGADAYYIISYPNSPFMEGINFALQEIKTDVDFEARLYHKYYDNSAAATTIAFTAAEKEYIASVAAGSPIKVALNAARAPFSSYNEKTGEFTGICVDVLNEVARKSGLVFDFVVQTPGATVPELLDSGRYNLVCGIERDNFTTNETIVSTEAFLDSSIVPVGRQGMNLNMYSSLTASVPKSFQALRKNLAAHYPNLNVVLYDSSRDCLDAVKNGEADIMIQNTHILSLLLQEPRFDDLEILPVDVMDEHTAMAMLRSENPLLLSVLNKCIAGIDDATISGSLIEHTFASPYQYTIGDFLYKFRAQFIVLTILLAICFALMISIIAARRRNEKALAKKNALLSDAVAQADRASVAKSQFLSRMSHEIRTPMNAIVGLTTIARQHLSDEAKTEDYLNKIETSSKVLLNIINDVLDMSAIESNKLKIAHEPFDLKQILSAISVIYYPQCENKGVSFQMATNLENELFKGDALRVNQILMNLVSNAYKFTPSGGTIKIFVNQTAQKDNTAFLRFSVSDTGCGMTDEMKSRLFKPFEQESADTAQTHGGSGLGLSIAKNLVDMMHGAIQAESEKGKGTVFHVDLPFEIVTPDRQMSSSALRSLRILAVDDEGSAREYTSIVLGRIGASFDTASSGAEALDMITRANEANTPYDVCLIDWRMPDMDGIEVTRRIRQSETKKTLIIIISAYDLNEVTDEAMAAGADHFVTKPLFQSTLFNVLMTLTKGELKSETAQADEYDFSGRTVLLAEDNEMNAEIATELLNMVHMQVVHAADGQCAVDMFSEAAPGAYDMILMDVQMPLLNGYEATRAIRALDRPDAKTIPILAMTANAFTEDVAAALSAGMNGHIAKPIDTQLLYRTITEYLNDKSR